MLNVFGGYWKILSKFIHVSLFAFPFSLVKTLSFIQKISVEHNLCRILWYVLNTSMNKTTNDTVYLRELTVTQPSSRESSTFEKMIKEGCLQEQQFKAWDRISQAQGRKKGEQRRPESRGSLMFQEERRPAEWLKENDMGCVRRGRQDQVH